MVRVNLINPRYLADQHLIAEYAEILILSAYVKKYPAKENIPDKYTLKTGHMRFFKDKTLYLKKRHEQIINEMKKRGFAPKRTLNFKGIKKDLMNNWSPNPQDLQIIKKRLIYKIKLKPDWYRYYGEYKPEKFFVDMARNART